MHLQCQEQGPQNASNSIAMRTTFTLSNYRFFVILVASNSLRTLMSHNSNSINSNQSSSNKGEMKWRTANHWIIKPE